MRLENPIVLRTELIDHDWPVSNVIRFVVRLWEFGPNAVLQHTRTTIYKP